MPPVTPSLARFYNQQLDWRGCGDGFQCTDMTVPLDYAHPAGSTIKVAVIRLRSGSRHVGSLVINPGGPGGSGISYGRAARRVIPSSVREHYDVVGFDPRGVGASSPIRCVSNSFLDQFIAADPLESQSEIIRLSKQFAAACGSRARKLLSHIGTRDSARDLDILRAALGDTKLTYMGKSYGTFLGALYANLFPTHVRALILDGAIDPAETGEQSARTQAKGFETALTAFLRHCVANGCSLGSTYDTAGQKLNDMLNRAATQPLPAPRYRGADGRLVNRTELQLGIAAPLYNRSSWPELQAALASAQKGDGSAILALADGLWERSSDGSYSNLVEAFNAISCVDRESPTSLTTYQRDAVSWARESPHYGVFAAWGSLPCAYWPVPPVTKAAPLRAHGAPPILVIGTLRDPATPYVDAQRLADELDSGVLLTYDGDGHTVYGDGQSGCVDRIGNAYLLHLTVPQPGTRC
jgi:pimeloyl-ACP methyl ester carboxylesterase